MVKDQRRQQELCNTIRGMIDASSLEAEERVLVDLWRDLGDLTETYFSAMTAVHAFVEVHAIARTKLSSLPPLVAARVLESLAETLASQARLTRDIEKQKAEFKPSNPA